jgi:formylmethanofuran dehydrogenase subunit E
MGDIPENEQAWNKLAAAKQYRCEQCGELIPFGERTIDFERKLCGHCAHKLDKND